MRADVGWGTDSRPFGMGTGPPPWRGLKGDMDIRPLTDRYAVSPQIDPEDLPAIAAAGYKMVINNRPCAEIPPSHQADVMEAAVRAAGLDYVVLPITHATLGPDLAAAQRDACAGCDGPVLAYCASGTRSTFAWALGHASDMPLEEMMNAASAQGYDLSPLRPYLESLSNAS